MKISQPYSPTHIHIYTTHRDATIHRLEGLFTPFMEFSKYFNAYEEIRTHLSNNKNELSFFHFPLQESLNALNAIPLYTWQMSLRGEFDDVVGNNKKWSPSNNNNRKGPEEHFRWKLYKNKPRSKRVRKNKRKHGNVQRGGYGWGCLRG